jgi:hypothetical protein
MSPNHFRHFYIELETAVTWSKSNLNMMNIYEESTLNFWICCLQIYFQ